MTTDSGATGKTGRMIEDGEEGQNGSYKVYCVYTAMEKDGYKDDYLEENIKERTDIVADKTMKEKKMNDITNDKAIGSIYQDLVAGKTMEEKKMNDITTDKAIPDYMYVVYLSTISGLVAAAVGFASASQSISAVKWLQTCQKRCKCTSPLRRLSRVSMSRDKRNRLHQCQKRRALLWMFLLMHPSNAKWRTSRLTRCAHSTYNSNPGRHADTCKVRAKQQQHQPGIRHHKTT